MSVDKEIKNRSELADWLAETEMLEDSTEFRAFSPAVNGVEDERILPEANLEVWRLVKSTALAGQYCRYERKRLSFQLVHGWRQFCEACLSGQIEASISVGESEESALSFCYFDNVAQQSAELKFSVLKVTALEPVERMNQPQLGRDITVTLSGETVLSAIDIKSLFADAGHDLVWRAFSDVEKPADQVVMNMGHFLQFRNLLESELDGMMTDCNQTEEGVILHFSVWSRDNINAFRQAIADILKKLNVTEIRCGNCMLTLEQYVRVTREGTRCLSEIFPDRKEKK